MATHERAAWLGQATVELALMFIMFMVVFVAVFEFGRLSAVYLSLLNATREGARAGAVAGATDTEIQTAVQNAVLAFGSGLSTITPSICPATVNASATCAPLTSTFSRASGGALVVTLTYTFYFFPPVDLVLPNGLTFSVTGVTGIS